MPSANPFRLSKVPAEPAHTLQSSQSHRVGDGCVWGRGQVEVGVVGLCGYPESQKLWENEGVPVWSR